MRYIDNSFCDEDGREVGWLAGNITPDNVVSFSFDKRADLDAFLKCLPQLEVCSCSIHSKTSLQDNNNKAAAIKLLDKQIDRLEDYILIGVDDETVNAGMQQITDLTIAKAKILAESGND
jgi:hypothetical protein